MSKQTILGRVSQLVRANVNALIDQAEDPERLIDQLVRDYTRNISEAEQAVAQTIGNLRMAEQDHREDVEAAAEWGRKALAASNRADQMRDVGLPDEAARFDTLAKIAIGKQIAAESEAQAAEPAIASQTEIVAQLKGGLATMREKLEELKTKRNQLISRSKVADAQTKILDATRSIDILDPSSELGRFEDQIRRVEARVRGSQELQASSVESQFAELEDIGQQSEIDARLAALKLGS